jgi:uncharacterized protein DUF2690
MSPENGTSSAGVIRRSTRRRRGRSVVALVCALMFTIGASWAFGPASASAASTCSDSSCNGKDPNIYGCSGDAVSLDSWHDSWLNVELRYSRKCYPAWARVSYIQSVPEPGACCNVASINWYSCSAADSSCYLGEYVSGSVTQQGVVKWMALRAFSYWVRACGWADPTLCTRAH